MVGPWWGRGGVVVARTCGPQVDHTRVAQITSLVATKFDSMGDMLIWPIILASEKTANFTPIYL